MKRYLACILLTFSSLVYSQDIQWADEVLDFSSEFGKRQYSVRQIVGKPNVLPNLGASPNAWAPKRKGREEFVKVGFHHPMRIRQIAVAETHNPGGIKQIHTYDAEGNEYLLHSFNARAILIEGRLFRFFFDETPYKVASIKLTIASDVLDGHFGIDAIAISSSLRPIPVEINITDEIDKDYIPVALDSNINSPYNELRPLISPDANTLFFSRQNHPGNIGGIKDDEDIWIAERDPISGKWLEASNIGRPLNNKGPNFISSVSSDGNAMLLLLGNAYYSRNRMTQGVSMSVKGDDGTWSTPRNLDIENDYNLSAKANYFLSNDRNTIIMSVEREDSYGDRDIYAIFLKDDGSWTVPVNLGPSINSADEEAAPFLAKDGKTLFFSSKGLSGYGGFDIYLSRRLDDTWQSWSEPENLGPGFNSGEDDIFFNFTEGDEYAYFTRGLKSNTDIYKAKLPYYQKPEIPTLLTGLAYKNPNVIVSIKGKVYDAKTKAAIGSSIEFIKGDHLSKIQLVAAESHGYKTTLDQGFKYNIIAKADGYYNGLDSLDLTNISNSIEIEKDIYLDPVIKDTPIVLMNVYFDFDSDHIRPVSFPELDKLSEMLLDNPKLLMTVNGHTCSLGSAIYNQDLSHRRAGAIVTYLENRGVAQNRLKYNGYGESLPKVQNNSEANRKLNRRVEFELSEVEDPGLP